MGMDTFLMEQAKHEEQCREDDKHNARLVVAGYSKSNEDCALLLSALGLLEKE